MRASTKLFSLTHALQTFTHSLHTHTQSNKTTNLSEKEGSLCGVLRWISGHVGGLQWEHRTKYVRKHCILDWLFAFRGFQDFSKLVKACLAWNTNYLLS